MSTLSPAKRMSVDCLSDLRGRSHGSEMNLLIRQDGQSRGRELETPKRPDFQIHTYADASFWISTSGERSKSGFLICLVVPGTGEYSVLQWSSRRQTVTAHLTPEAEIVAMSEGIMTSLLTYDAAEFLGVCASVSPQLKIRLKTDSDTGLRKLKNDSIMVRNRPFGICYSYLRDVCYGTLLLRALILFSKQERIRRLTEWPGSLVVTFKWNSWPIWECVPLLTCESVSINYTRSVTCCLG